MGVCAAAAALLLACGADAYIYHIAQSFQGGQTSQEALVLSEGTMFASHQGPFGSDGVSSISAKLTLAAVPDGSPAAAQTVNVWLAFLDEGTRAAVGHSYVDGATNLVVTDYCCTPALLSSRACGAADVGGLIVYPDTAPRPIQANFTAIPASTTGVAFDGSAEVAVFGRQYMLLALCDPSPAGSGLAMPAVSFSLDLAFRNPYGYLPGQVYGLLPFYGALFVAYLLFALALGGAMAAKRRYIIALQYYIVGVVLASLVESATFFFTYQSKNESGVPTPCSDCGAPTADYLTAVGLSVLKRAVSRGLLLAVAMGFGVVYPTLSRRGTYFILGLSVAYAVFGLIDDLQRQTAYEAAVSMWELPVALLDLVFLMGIYGGLGRLRRELEATGQAAKAQMYTRLYYVLAANVSAWSLVTVAQVLVRARLVAVDWTATFLFASFWDALYLAILLAVAAIWAPGETAFQYTYYSQAAGAAGGVGGVAGGAEGEGEGEGAAAPHRDSFDDGGTADAAGDAANEGAGAEEEGIELRSTVKAKAMSPPAKAATAAAAAAAASKGKAPPAKRAAAAPVDDDDAGFDSDEDAAADDIEIRLGGGSVASGHQQQHSAAAAAFAIGSEEDEAAEGPRVSLAPAHADTHPAPKAQSAAAAAGKIVRAKAPAAAAAAPKAAAPAAVAKPATAATAATDSKPAPTPSANPVASAAATGGKAVASAVGAAGKTKLAPPRGFTPTGTAGTAAAAGAGAAGVDGPLDLTKLD